MALTRDQIVRADDLPREEVNVPEWGGSVFVRMMTGSERESIEASFQKRNKKADGFDWQGFRVEVIILTVCDDTGNSLFKKGDEALILGKSSAVIDRIYMRAMRLNRLGEDDIEDTKKN
jgi:hypothetical protein